MKTLEVKDGKLILPERITWATLNQLLRQGYSITYTVEKDGLKSDEQQLVRTPRPVVQPRIKF